MDYCGNNRYNPGNSSVVGFHVPMLNVLNVMVGGLFAVLILDLLLRCLENVPKIFSQMVVIFMVMKPMVESVNNHQLKQIQDSRQLLKLGQPALKRKDSTFADISKVVTPVTH